MLNLASNGLRTKGLDLGRWLCGLEFLVEIYLEDNGQLHGALLALRTDADLECLPNLRSLNLANNWLGPVGAKHVAEAIKGHVSALPAVRLTPF